MTIFRPAHILAFLMLTVSPCWSGEAEEANRLFVRSIQAWHEAQNLEVSQSGNLLRKAELLEQIRTNLQRIVQDYPGSDIAVQLVIGNAVGPLSLQGVEAAAEQARPALGVAECLPALASDCVGGTLLRELELLRRQVGSEVRNASYRETIQENVDQTLFLLHLLLGHNDVIREAMTEMGSDLPYFISDSNLLFEVLGPAGAVALDRLLTLDPSGRSADRVALACREGRLAHVEDLAVSAVEPVDRRIALARAALCLAAGGQDAKARALLEKQEAVPHQLNAKPGYAEPAFAADAFAARAWRLLGETERSDAVLREVVELGRDWMKGWDEGLVLSQALMESGLDIEVETRAVEAVERAAVAAAAALIAGDAETATNIVTSFASISEQVSVLDAMIAVLADGGQEALAADVARTMPSEIYTGNIRMDRVMDALVHAGRRKEAAGLARSALQVICSERGIGNYAILRAAVGFAQLGENLTCEDRLESQGRTMHVYDSFGPEPASELLRLAVFQASSGNAKLMQEISRGYTTDTNGGIDLLESSNFGAVMLVAALRYSERSDH